MPNHKLVGLPNALQAKGIVSNDDEYSDLFNKAKFTPQGLDELIRRLKAGEKWEPTFDPVHLSYAELWNVLFLQNEGNIPAKSEHAPYYNVKIDPYSITEDDNPWTHRYVNLSNGKDAMRELMTAISEMREVDPRDIEGLPGLDPYVNVTPGRTREYQKRHRPDRDVAERLAAIYQKAYEKASELKPGTTPQVLFALKERSRVRSNVMRSPIEYAEDALKGTRYMSPMSDLIRLRIELLYANPYELENQYPLFVSKTGKAIALLLSHQDSWLTLRETQPSQIDEIAAPITVLS